MATYEATTHPVAFAHMEGGMKTVYVTPWTPEYSVITSGDRIEFDHLGSITIGAIRKYSTLDELMGAEGFGNVVPEADDEDHAKDLLRTSPDWDQEAENTRGVIALRVRWAKRKS